MKLKFLVILLIISPNNVLASEITFDEFLDHAIEVNLEKRGSLLENHWFASTYEEGSSTGGIMEALQECSDNGGGSVAFGNVRIDASGMQSPIVRSPSIWTDRLHKSVAPCDLVGYCSDTSTNPTTAKHDVELADSCSALRIDNSNEMIANEFGEKTALEVTGNLQVLRDFSIWMDDMDAQSRCIVTKGGIDRAPISEISIQRIGCAGDYDRLTSSTESIGLDFQATMRSQVIGSTFRNFGTGIEFGNTPLDQPLKNNSNVLINNSVRSNHVGIAFRTWHACSEVSLIEMIIEGNTKGLVAEDNAACRIGMIGGHFEQVAPSGIVNVEITTRQATRLLTFNTYFGGTPGWIFNEETRRWEHSEESWDVVRTAQAPGYGFDKFVGSTFGNGINYPGAFAYVSEPYSVKRVRGYVYSDDQITHPNNCAKHLMVTNGSVQGRTCRQMDDFSLWIAKPIDNVGREGISDNLAEVQCIENCSTFFQRLFN